jgi:GMP synthase (glutamine-hydrolysing)
MKVLAVVNGTDAPPGSFADVVAERGDQLETWVPVAGPPPAADAHDAVMVFGGAMNVDQEPEHPWLRDEECYLRSLLDRRVPILGVCLGAQMLAVAAGAAVGPAPEPEIGWHDVERTADDEVLGTLPRRFSAFQWHSYAFDLPARAVELARSRVCLQAFRVGETAWGVQFHPEVTREIVAGWAEQAPGEAPAGLLEQTDERIGRWERSGRKLCGAFLDSAERALSAA